MTFTIRVTNPHTVRLIEELAALQLLELVNAPASNDSRKLSERMAGSITPDQAEQMRRELDDSRNEWERSF